VAVAFRAFLILALASAGLAAAEPKLDSLLVYGPGYMFTVKEPAGWQADTANAARLHANIAFYRSGETLNSAAALIRIRVNDKADDDTAEDLKADMEGYRRKQPGIQFEDVVVSHASYATFPKLFFVDGTFYEYVTYVNPGKGVSFLLSVSMNKQKVKASGAELEALREVVRTLTFYSGVQVKGKGKPGK
jgi:hypothetical protein